MGDRLIQSSDGRALIRVAIVSGAVDDDEAICAWYASSARIHFADESRRRRG